MTLLTNINTVNTMSNPGNDLSLPTLTKSKTAVDGSTGGLPIKDQQSYIGVKINIDSSRS